ncbi:hypothetical protein [Undibacterium sp. Ji49W]|uniref:hypothetical protein n=1 Tax=Undibacterium sp. Ji49W TaxID=3413040 RepID=UPI003BF10CF9
MHYTHVKCQDGKLKAGEFVFHSDSSPGSKMAKGMHKRKTIVHAFTEEIILDFL